MRSPFNTTLSPFRRLPIWTATYSLSYPLIQIPKLVLLRQKSLRTPGSRKFNVVVSIRMNCFEYKVECLMPVSRGKTRLRCLLNINISILLSIKSRRSNVHVNILRGVVFADAVHFRLQTGGWSG